MVQSQVNNYLHSTNPSLNELDVVPKMYSYFRFVRVGLLGKTLVNFILFGPVW